MKQFLNTLWAPLKFIWVGITVIALGSLPWSVRATDNQVTAQQQGTTYMYAVKVVCVPTLGRAAPAVVPGMYRTAVNVHNPWPQPAKIVKWLTLSPPQGQASITGIQISETLEPFQAFDIDCVHMAKEFGLENQRVPGGKGFLIIQSDQDIDVVAVYTAEERVGATAGGTAEETEEQVAEAARGSAGVGLGLDIEYIKPKIAQGPLPDPDLTVKITNGPTPDCSGNPCTTTIEFMIMNVSSTSVTGAFEVLIEATGLPSKTILVSGLTAGASQTLSETLTGFCFNPDCTGRVTVDSGNVIPESNETNNVSEVTIPG